MKIEHVQKQDYFTETLVEELIRQGVDHFCIAPGSRSARLTIAIARSKLAHKTVHFDERGLGFYALGAAKASKKPVAIVVTSGTAVGNLFPAVMEASLDGIPLIILSCDRPIELFDTGANQTADQGKIFGKYVRWELDVGAYENLPSNFIATTVAQGLYKAKTHNPGPIQINCRFREPFFDAANPQEELSRPISFSTKYEKSEPMLSTQTAKEYVALFESAKKGVILLGSFPTPQNLEPIFSLAETLGWPIISDISSNARVHGWRSNHIRYANFLLNQEDLKSDFILQFGNRFVQFGNKHVAKAVLPWVKSQASVPYCMVTDHPNRQDPEHLVTHRIQQNPALFAEQILALLSETERKDTSWLESWQTRSDLIATTFAHSINQDKLTEPGVFFALSKFLPSSYALFIASSMPIRDANFFFYPKHPSASVFVNRGLAGIDGNIATAVGIAEGIKKPVLAVLGDLTFLHDINSLALLKNALYPVICLVINNQGGAIFSFSPVQEKKDVFEEYFATSHDFSFSHAALLFGIPYMHLQTEDWKEALERALLEGKSCIIEISTNREENLLLHKQITEMAVAACEAATELV
jgi:2-succinyl-5-enolpyruvyl-6-hydroxy-3-cyclohexene-1-carboxylate synthase